MLKKGDHAVYGMNGVCEITDIEERESGKFYRMVPENDKGLTIFLPVTTDRLRPPTDRKEAEELLNSIPDMPDIWTDDSKSRRRKCLSINFRRIKPQNNKSRLFGQINFLSAAVG